MHFQRRFRRLLVLTALVCGLLPLGGCHLLNLLPTRNDKVDPPKTDAGKGPPPADAAALPGKCQYRVSQFLFYADFEIKRDLPLFKELADMREQIHKTLQLPPASNLIQVYLFEDRDRFERFLEARHPDLPKRRAFFIADPRPISGETLVVYTYWGNGDRIQQDLRHELTHALLHTVIKDVPLWLDEGLAEYFEVAPGRNGVNADHLRLMRHGATGPVTLDLASLEQLRKTEQLADMTPAKYREAWAWVHLMLHGNGETRKVLVNYLKDLRTGHDPGLLRPRLLALVPAPEMVLDRHLALMDQITRPAPLAN
jgi:hypothetical protein